MNDEVKIINIKQAIVYSQNGVQPIRIEMGFNNKVVFVFDKKKTNALYTRWLNNEFKDVVYDFDKSDSFA